MTTAENEVFMGSYNENCYLEGDTQPLISGNKNLVEAGYCRRIFSSGEMNKILNHVGTSLI